MMLRQAASEIRFHPGRFVATLLAIAISVGFIVAISTAVNTESKALARSGSVAISRADIVVTGQFPEGTDVIGILDGIDGVTAASAAAAGQALLGTGQESAWVTMLHVPPEALRWAELADGCWPAADGEIALSADGARKLGVGVGDAVPRSDDAPPLTLVGITADARSFYTVTGYGWSDLVGEPNQSYQFAVRTDQGATQDMIDRIAHALPAPAEWSGDVQVESADEVRQAVSEGMTGDIDVFKYLLYGFAGVALIVGMIIIANTFTILVTQRRRQIGLLRAVGASTGQVRRRIVGEALLLGIAGSILGIGLGVGVAAIAAYLTGALFWGLSVSAVEIGIAAGVGVLATLISALGPSLAATRVTPLEALQVVPTATQAKRAGMARTVICVLCALAGAGLIVLSYTSPTYALAWAILAGGLISVAVLAAAPLYVAPILRLLGKAFGFAGPTTRLAAENAARNPRRAAATTVALMLAVGLVVTLQVAVATMHTTGVAAIEEKFPMDLSARLGITYAELAEGEESPGRIAAQGSLGDDYLARVAAVDGVAATATVRSIVVRANDELLQVRDTNAARAEMGLPGRLDVADGEIIVSTHHGGLGQEVTLDGASGPVTLKVRRSDSLPYEAASVSGATFDALGGDPVRSEVWVKLADRTAMGTISDVVEVMGTNPNVEVEGGAVMAGMLNEVLGVILLVLSALLGVAVVIALVGVSNTLGLSVIERQRESALLRALGMQRSGLRAMLLIEALLLALFGTVVGVLAGAFFGWLGVTSAFRMIGDELDIPIHFSLDAGLTAALIGVCLLAAALASVLPGRRAANATPTEALAVE